MIYMIEGSAEHEIVFNENARKVERVLAETSELLHPDSSAVENSQITRGHGS